MEIHPVFGVSQRWTQLEQETFNLGVCQQKLPKRPQDIQKEIDERNNLWVFLEE